MKFIMLNGPSCAGKSTVIKRIMAEEDHFYQLSSDYQKWMFSKFDRSIHFEDVRSLAENVCKLGYNIICDSALHRENREMLLSVARTHGYTIVEINLDAPYEALEPRFLERVVDAKAKGSTRITNTSVERFKELYDIYQEGKNPAAIPIRADQNTADEVYKKVLEHIK
jgi:predicted kinase